MLGSTGEDRQRCSRVTRPCECGGHDWGVGGGGEGRGHVWGSRC